METQKVWTTDTKEGFILGKYIDIGHNGEVTIIPNNSKYPSVKTHIDRVYPAEEYDNKDVPDNCMLR